MLVHAAEQVEALSVQDGSEMTLTKQNEGNYQLFTSEAKLKSNKTWRNTDFNS